jgi:uncharacterized membrane protein (DUF441 family)
MGVGKHLKELADLGITLGVILFALGIFQNVVSTNANANQALGTVITQFMEFVSTYLGPVFGLVALIIVFVYLKETGLWGSKRG